MKLFNIRLSSHKAIAVQAGVHVGHSTNLVESTRRTALIPALQAPASINSPLYEADIVVLPHGTHLTHAGAARADHAILLIEFQDDAKAFNASIFQAREIVQAGDIGHSKDTYALVTMVPGDNVVIKRSWTVLELFRTFKFWRWLSRGTRSWHTLIHWDGNDIVTSSCKTVPPLNANPNVKTFQQVLTSETQSMAAQKIETAPTVEKTAEPQAKVAPPAEVTPPPAEKKPEPVVQLTPPQEIARIISLKNDECSKADLARAFTLLREMAKNIQAEDSRSNLIIDSATALSIKMSETGDKESAHEPLKLAMLILYATPKTESNRVTQNRAKVHGALERLKTADGQGS